MCAWQIARGHQELVHDLTAGEDKGLLEQLDPLFFGKLAVRIQPGSERTMFFLDFLDPLRIDDSGVDLQAIADDPRVCKQAGNIVLLGAQTQAAGAPARTQTIAPQRRETLSVPAATPPADRPQLIGAASEGSIAHSRATDMMTMCFGFLIDELLRGEGFGPLT